MDFDIEKAINYPFKDPKWVSKFGIYFGITLGLSIIAGILRLTTNIFSGLSDALPEEYAESFVTIVPSLMAFFVSIISLPIQLYFQGYQYENMKNVMNGEEYPMPEHNNFGYKFRLWWQGFLAHLVPGIVSFVLAMLIITPVTLLSIYIFSNDSEPFAIIITVIAIIIAVLLLIAVGGFFGWMVHPSITYIFLKDGNLSDVLNINRIISIIKKAWVKYLAIYGISIVVSMAGSLLSTILCFIGFIVAPFITVMTVFISNHLFGQVFADTLARENAGE